MLSVGRLGVPPFSCFSVCWPGDAIESRKDVGNDNNVDAKLNLKVQFDNELVGRKRRREERERPYDLVIFSLVSRGRKRKKIRTR